MTRQRYVCAPPKGGELFLTVQSSLLISYPMESSSCLRLTKGKTSSEVVLHIRSISEVLHHVGCVTIPNVVQYWVSPPRNLLCAPQNCAFNTNSDWCSTISKISKSRAPCRSQEYIQETLPKRRRKDGAVDFTDLPSLLWNATD
jgi:hypothetical protein